MSAPYRAGKTVTTTPLSPEAMAILRRLPLNRAKVNPGIRHVLLSRGLALMADDYKIHPTPKGRSLLAGAVHASPE